MKNFENELPEGYKLAKVVDAKDKKTVIILNTVAFVIMIAVAAVLYFILKPKFIFDYDNDSLFKELIKLAVFCVSMFAYIVLHELVHGLAYKLLTKQKLVFGMTLSVAYCGVPNIYVYRKASIIALVSPLVVFTIIFGALLFIIKDPLSLMLAILLFSVHISGCVGDIYDTLLYMFKFRDKTTLMRDTGPKQEFYTK